MRCEPCGPDPPEWPFRVAPGPLRLAPFRSGFRLGESPAVGRYDLSRACRAGDSCPSAATPSVVDFQRDSTAPFRFASAFQWRVPRRDTLRPGRRPEAQWLPAGRDPFGRVPAAGAAEVRPVSGRHR